VVRVLELVTSTKRNRSRSRASTDGARAGDRGAVDLSPKSTSPASARRAGGLVEGGELEVVLGLVALLVRGGHRLLRLGPGGYCARDVLVLARLTSVARAARCRVGRRGAEPVEGKTEEPLPQEDHLLGLGEHAETPGRARASRADSRSTRSPNAWRWRSRSPRSPRDELVHPLRHLGGRPLREGEGEDLLGRARLPAMRWAILRVRTWSCPCPPRR